MWRSCLSLLAGQTGNRVQKSLYQIPACGRLPRQWDRRGSPRGEASGAATNCQGSGGEHSRAAGSDCARQPEDTAARGTLCFIDRRTTAGMLRSTTSVPLNARASAAG